MRLERLEDRTLLTLAPAASIGELAPAALGPGYLYSRMLDLGQYLAALPATANGPLADVASASTSLNVPKLRNNAGATAKLFLDFDGHDEAKWGDRKNVHTPAFTMDSNVKSFSGAELAAINEIWARVAEDFAPFNIDVTTVDPGTYPRGRVAVIAIGGDYSDWYGDASGGVAHVAGFTDNYAASNVGYVFSRTLDYRANWIADAASHEAGHLFGLNHQATWSESIFGNTLAEDYKSGNSLWAPLMGVSYDAERSTWDNGTPDTSGDVTQDDMAIIASAANGFGYRADDFADTFQAATALPVSGAGASFSGWINRSDDRDVWKITTAGGKLGFELSGISVGSNLDGELELWNSDGQLIATNNASDSLNAKLDVSVDAGTYYLVARGGGDYGDAGRYTITTSAPAPEIEVLVDGVSTTGVVDFGSPAIGVPVVRTITILNVGNAPLTLASSGWLDQSGILKLLSDTAKSSLNPGESTSFTLEFKATSEIIFSDFIQIANNDMDESPFWLNLRAKVVLPNPWGIEVKVDGSYAVDNQFFTFGNTQLGIPLTKTVTVTNQGTVPLLLDPLNSNIGTGFTLISNLGSNVLAPGESTEFQVRLDGMVAGGYDCNLYFNGDRDGSQFRLWFEGFVGQTLDVLDQGVNVLFGTADLGRSAQGTWRTKTITLTNRGSDAVLLNPLSASDVPNGFTLLSGLPTTSLAAGQSTFFAVRLDTSVVGEYTGTIDLFNDGHASSHDLTLTAIVTPAPAPEIALAMDGQELSDGGKLNIGEVVQGGSITTTFTVTNLGSVWLHLAPVNSGQTPSGFSFVSNLDRTAIGPGESTTLTVRMTAAALGSLTGVVQLLSNDSDEGTYDVAVSGTGTAPQRQVVDDGDAGNAFAGNWKQTTGKGYGRDIHYASKGKGYVYSVWGFNNLAFGQYRVYATWPAGNKNASNAPFMMFDGVGYWGLVRANQRVAPGPQSASGRWKALGIVSVFSGQLVVTLTNAANGIVVADAVYIEQVSGLASQPQIINAGSASATSNSKANTLALGQFSANAADLVPANAEFLSPPTTTPNSPGQSTTIATPPTTAAAKAAGPAELADVQSVDGIRTRLAKREPDTLSNIVDQLVWEQSTDHHEAAGNSLEIRDKLLASLLTHDLPPFVC